MLWLLPLQVVATCKHFLGYGLEGAEGVSRYSHNLDLAPQDLADTDLPPFEACVQVRRGTCHYWGAGDAVAAVCIEHSTVQCSTLALVHCMRGCLV